MCEMCNPVERKLMPEELGTLFPLLLGLSVPITVSFGFYFIFSLSFTRGWGFVSH